MVVLYSRAGATNIIHCIRAPLWNDKQAALLNDKLLE